MYVPQHFAEDRLEVLHGLIEAHPLGALVRLEEDGLAADHLPFELAPPSGEAPYGLLRAHVARSNPLWRQDGAAVLVLFQGPSGYVSPALYDARAVDGRVVPTWNYAVVHAHGRLRSVDDAAWLLAHMGRMTRRQEGRDHGHGWEVEDAPRDYIDKLVRATVGIEIVIERLQGKWKASQNRGEAERARIAHATGMAAFQAPGWP
ncbi:transcriptional regulator [Massilia sp. WF1]|uniref:FMN-binding negative transcriptional regulator n=1 Tax=unclassified Massilia TaxID=2609279 RepID=UPI000649BD59|nr:MULTISPECIES: FMN-binding negative transcriptional regulator [unclassified Massilia]ALK95553.1 transcriptional regulator [Massilia sp. WG5]KLU37293.1 transcriptional regulator [Massilia sp. WF1]